MDSTATQRDPADPPRPARGSHGAAVRAAAVRVARSLDEALDLTRLAADARLSPLHFHRIFRGLIGETPLELHRRLRLERAAQALLESDLPVTRIALDAGYDSHEAFTRSFRAAYGRAPRDYRSLDPALFPGQPDPSLPQPSFPNPRLPARCRLHFADLPSLSGHPVHPVHPGHFDPASPVDDLAALVQLREGDPAMQVDLLDLEPIRLACVRHIGPYHQIAEAYGRLGAIAGPAGLFHWPGARLIGIYYDSPEVTPATQLRADAAISVAAGTTVPPGLTEGLIPAGRYARTLHVGPYEQLGDVWSRLMGGWLESSGEQLGNGPTFELYRNDPTTVRPEALETEIYIPLA